MARKRRLVEEPPEGGWLGAPPTTELKPLAEAVRSDRKGGWIWRDIKQTPEDKKLRVKWDDRVEAADSKDRWRFKWPPRKDE